MNRRKEIFEYRCFQVEKRAVERADDQSECKSEEEGVLDEMFSGLSTRKTLATTSSIPKS